MQVLKKELYLAVGPVAQRGIERAFEAEVQLLDRFHHPNLVRLLGWARGEPATGDMALVYELMAGGSLYQRLFEARPGVAPLTFAERWVLPCTDPPHTAIIGLRSPSPCASGCLRLSISIDVARGLLYLHGHTDDGRPTGPPVLHRDVKVRSL